MQSLSHAQTELLSREYSPGEHAKRYILFSIGASNYMLRKYIDAEQIYLQTLDLTPYIAPNRGRSPRPTPLSLPKTTR